MNAFVVFKFSIPTFSLSIIKTNTLIRMNLWRINKFYQYLDVDVLLSSITH